MYWLLSFWGQCSPHVESVVFSEDARNEVVQFFQRQDTRQTSSEWRGSQGWLLLKSLLLMTADSSVSDKELTNWFSSYWDYTDLYEGLSWYCVLDKITSYSTFLIFSHYIKRPCTGAK